MAHDGQEVENRIEGKRARRQSDESLEVLADWLSLFAQVYREEITEELALLYRITLVEVPAKTLHKAFLRVAKRSKFRPTPAEVMEAVCIENEIQEAERKTVYPIVSQDEREAAMQETEEQRNQIKKQLGLIH